MPALTPTTPAQFNAERVVAGLKALPGNPLGAYFTARWASRLRRRLRSRPAPDGARMYYVGIGGNTNTTTRFRRYDGAGERVLLAEYLDKAHLLEGNREYKVQIAVYNGCTSVTLDGETLFSYRDPQPLTDGYFGFRTTQSRQEIDDFKMHQLK